MPVDSLHQFFGEMKGGCYIILKFAFAYIYMYIKFYCTELNKNMYIIDNFPINNTVGSYFYSNSS